MLYAIAMGQIKNIKHTKDEKTAQKQTRIMWPDIELSYHSSSIAAEIKNNC